jgi:archaellum component FlaC
MNECRYAREAALKLEIEELSDKLNKLMKENIRVARLNLALRSELKKLREEKGAILDTQQDLRDELTHAKIELAGYALENSDLLETQQDLLDDIQDLKTALGSLGSGLAGAGKFISKVREALQDLEA